jgi:hypothetical protein
VARAWAGLRLSTERTHLESHLKALEASQPRRIDIGHMRKVLPQALDRLLAWVTEADGEDRTLMLEALQVQVTASKDKVLIEGVIPTVEANVEGCLDQIVITIERTSGCVFNSHQNGIPIKIETAL